jgi:magnesium transporter
MIRIWHEADWRHEGLDAQTLIAAPWIDASSPDESERDTLEVLLQVELPERAEMSEIEASSRLFAISETLFLTTPVLSDTETDQPVLAPLTMVLHRGQLITLRYHEPRSIALFAGRIRRSPVLARDGSSALIGLIDTIVDRTADIAEMLSRRLDESFQEVFLNLTPDVRSGKSRNADLQKVLREVGRTGDLIGKLRDSIAGQSRLVAFLNASLPGKGGDLRQRLKVAARDLQSLTEHANFQAQRMSMLLDATLGAINIEQNVIVRSFSVAAAAFFPPALIAGIYGMNFDFMPELHEAWGYPVALGVMVASAVIPLWYFRRRGWM